MPELTFNTYRFRHMDGNIATVAAQDESTARAMAMERRWGLPHLNTTWACSRWQGLGLTLVDERGLPIEAVEAEPCP